MCGLRTCNFNLNEQMIDALKYFHYMNIYAAPCIGHIQIFDLIRFDKIASVLWFIQFLWSTWSMIILWVWRLTIFILCVIRWWWHFFFLQFKLIDDGWWRMHYAPIKIITKDEKKTVKYLDSGQYQKKKRTISGHTKSFDQKKKKINKN